MRTPPAPRESAIQSAVVAHWRALGFPNTLVAAIPNQRAHGQAGLTAGLPDLVVIGGVVRITFLELKTATGRVSRPQAMFLNLCRFVGIECVVAYGRDEPIALLEAGGVVRTQVRTAE